MNWNLCLLLLPIVVGVIGLIVLGIGTILYFVICINISSFHAILIFGIGSIVVAGFMLWLVIYIIEYDRLHLINVVAQAPIVAVEEA
jgi:hypothetical protein